MDMPTNLPTSRALVVRSPNEGMSMSNELQKLPLFKDRGDKHEPERLGQGPIITTLRHAIHQLPPPGCIALYGSWGTGKTSILRQTKALEDANTDERRTVWFDPWEYERHGEVLPSLLHATITQLVVSDASRQRWKELAVGVVKTTLSLATRVTTAFALGGGLGDDTFKSLATMKPEEFKEHFEQWKGFHDEVAGLKKAFREMVDTALEGRSADARLVVFLDDLDRCLPDNVIALIEGIKLFLCGSSACRATFVFALDRRIVGEAIRHRYPGSTAYTGENYLEKIFDLSMEVPPVSMEHVQDFIRAEFADNPDVLETLVDALQHEDFLPPHLPQGLGLIARVLSAPVFANPRVIKRTLNRLVLLLGDKERFARIHSTNDGQSLMKLLLWMAGAERFRSFRQLFREASDKEVESIIIVLLGGQRPGLSAEATNLTLMSGLREYIALYELKEHEWSGERSPTADSRLRTLRDIDDFLSAAGL